mmetsp:Transcript_31530/g.86850  ORF Transcript_31530/g.86850 Transcript_31530/m.86850 type:complete len:335 (-) Transcript_31530:9-1013(-)
MDLRVLRDAHRWFSEWSGSVATHTAEEPPAFPAVENAHRRLVAAVWVVAEAPRRAAHANRLPRRANIMLETIEGADVVPRPAKVYPEAALAATAHAIVRPRAHVGQREVAPHVAASDDSFEAFLLENGAVQTRVDFFQRISHYFSRDGRVEADIELNDVVLARNDSPDASTRIVLVGLHEREIGANRRQRSAWPEALQEMWVQPWPRCCLAFGQLASPSDRRPNHCRWQYCRRNPRPTNPICSDAVTRGLCSERGVHARVVFKCTHQAVLLHAFWQKRGVVEHKRHRGHRQHEPQRHPFRNGVARHWAPGQRQRAPARRAPTMETLTPHMPRAP